MKYESAVETMAVTSRDELDRADIIIREMTRLTNDLLDYRYVATHYEGDSQDVLKDKINTIKNSLAVLLGDLDIYMEYMDITDKVNNKKQKRVIELVKKNKWM